MQEEHKQFILVRAKKALRPAGGEIVLSHRSACTGVNTSRCVRGCTEEGRNMGF